LFSSHITSDLERVADRVAVLKDGRIVYQGEMDALKDQVKRLHVVAAGPLNGAFQVPGTLQCSVSGNQAHLSVRGFTPELPVQIAQQWAAVVQVQDFNLEEIFLEMHHG
jgi:ABC-2 type transport system ATP-binding protein